MIFTSSYKQPIRYFIEGCLFQVATIPFGVLVDWTTLMPGIFYSSTNYHDIWQDVLDWNQKWITSYNNTVDQWKYEEDFHSWKIREIVWKVFVNPLYSLIP